MKYDPKKAHLAMAVMCDSQMRTGEIFWWMADPSLPADGKAAVAKELREKYT